MSDAFGGTTCPNCGEEEVELVTDQAGDTFCTQCYCNEDCPDRCATAHPEPSYDCYSNEWECPETGTEYVYCDYCGDWVQRPTYSDPERINGEWVCDPHNHDFTRCNDCGEWVHYDDAMYDDYGDYSYCRDCFRGQTEADQTRYARCAECRTGIGHGTVYFDDESEKAYCQEHGGSRGFTLLEAA